MSQDENELMELRRANCQLALERERLIARIEDLKTSVRILTEKYECAQTYIAALQLEKETA